MKIYIEASSLFQRRTGIGQYSKRLIEQVSKIDKNNSYTLFAFLFAKKEPNLPVKSSNVYYKFIKFMPSKVYSRLLKSGVRINVDKLIGAPADLYIFTNFVVWPISKSKRAWSIIYDVSFIEYPEYSEPKNRKYLMKFVGQTVKRSEKIITISENAKREILEHYPDSKGKIEIINPAVDHEQYFPRNKNDISQVKKKYNISGSYILYTGTLEPRKNIVGIINAYAKLTNHIKDKISLVLAGGAGWLDTEIYNKLEEYKSLNIIKTGYIDDEDLPALYSGASVFVYPSYYEGFGMPPLEAMACGTPVITSSSSSLPEVVGNAGIMVKPDDINSLTLNIEKVLKDKILSSDMTEKGIIQAKKFSWEKSANKFIKLIDSLNK